MWLLSFIYNNILNIFFFFYFDVCDSLGEKKRMFQ